MTRICSKAFKYLVLTAAFIAAFAPLQSANAQKDLTIAQVQGDKNTSPFVDQTVRVSGIVTARVRTGFFIQTPDDRTDGDATTSEGIFVFTQVPASPNAAIGNLVSVTGKVEEFRRNNEPFSLSITEITIEKGSDSIRIISAGNTLPKPITLTASDFAANAIDQLEKFEGMRVAVAEAMVVAPTDGRVDNRTGLVVSDGAFSAVLKGIPRPFRGLGMDIREYLASPDRDKLKKEFPKLPVFDANPEVIRVDTDEQAVSHSVKLSPEAEKLGITGGGHDFSQPIDAAALTGVKGVRGVLHYAFGKYTIYTDHDSRPEITTSIKPNPLPAAGADQFSIAAMNLENFFDDIDEPGIKEDVVSAEIFERRLRKISAAIRENLRSPDVIGVIEVENLAALKRLAVRLNSDSTKSGGADPRYEAYLIDGNDGRGIDNGYLIKASRVKVLEVRQVGKNDEYKNPKTGESDRLNDRPPLMLRASLTGPKSGEAFEFTAVVNHMKSMLGYSDPKQQDNVRMKKRLQAEFLAKFVQDRQKADPAERMVLLGDFNSYQFNDGILDMIGIIKGEPAPRDQVLNYSPDIVDPNLINLVDLIDPSQRYSYTFDGNAQVLDHILITQTLKDHIKGFGFARVNADFPEVLKNDPSRPERFSDHDPAVAYFSFEGTAKKP